VLERLLVDPAYTRVVAPVRRPLGRSEEKLSAPVLDFEELFGNPRGQDDIFTVDDVFCCLGTTMKKAGSRDAFRRVDFEYPREAARQAAARGAGQFLLVTAMGADPNARIFYNRVKGEVEAAVSAQRFRRVVILRPSLLLGDRSERRPGERIAMFLSRPLSPLLRGPLAPYRPIEAEEVAEAMVILARKVEPGVHVIPSDQLRTVSSGGPDR
jgi:uncharacterized protein YbjT (DUF2867 family)